MSNRAPLKRLLEEYAAASPEQAALRAQFLGFVAAHPDCCRRELAIGHVTGSALLLDHRGERVLLTHHRKLDRWLQPGGHADGDTDLAAVALRECEEESGLPGLRVEPAVFDLDRHWIPERPGEPGHWHYDVRFVVHAGLEQDFQVSAESHALAWFSLKEVAKDRAFDASLRRMAGRFLARTVQSAADPA